MESQWLTWAKRLQAIAATGLHYCEDVYDRERYAEIDDIAQSMIAQLGSLPIEHIRGLLAHPGLHGYATPKIDVRAAVIKDGKVLLVCERGDGRWSLPGGMADVGLSATENVIKEVREEAGLRVSVTDLYSVRHRAKHAYDPDVRDFYKLHFLCQQSDGASPKPGVETTAAAFFSPDELPELSTERILAADIDAAFEFHAGTTRQTQFD
ncbi:MAG: NUDIX hydrolase [Pseudomonadota bacterium]